MKGIRIANSVKGHTTTAKDVHRTNTRQRITGRTGHQACEECKGLDTTRTASGMPNSAVGARLYFDPGRKKVNVSSYIAQYPIIRIGQSALNFTSWQTCSIEHHLNLGSIQPRCNQCAKTIRTQKYTTVYSQVIIHTAE